MAHLAYRSTRGVTGGPSAIDDGIYRQRPNTCRHGRRTRSTPQGPEPEQARGKRKHCRPDDCIRRRCLAARHYQTTCTRVASTECGRRAFGRATYTIAATPIPVMMSVPAGSIPRSSPEKKSLASCQLQKMAHLRRPCGHWADGLMCDCKTRPHKPRRRGA